MHQTKKGNQWYFGMKGHIGVDAGTGYVHTVTATAANVHDLDLGVILDWNRESWPSTVRFASGYRRLTLDLAINKNQSDESSLALRHEGPFVEASLSF